MQYVALHARHKKWSFSLRIFSVNVTTSAGNCRFGHIYWQNPLWIYHVLSSDSWLNAFKDHRNMKNLETRNILLVSVHFIMANRHQTIVSTALWLGKKETNEDMNVTKHKRIMLGSTMTSTKRKDFYQPY